MLLPLGHFPTTPRHQPGPVPPGPWPSCPLALAVSRGWAAHPQVSLISFGAIQPTRRCALPSSAAPPERCRLDVAGPCALMCALGHGLATCIVYPPISAYFECDFRSSPTQGAPPKHKPRPSSFSVDVSRFEFIQVPCIPSRKTRFLPGFQTCRRGTPNLPVIDDEDTRICFGRETSHGVTIGRSGTWNGHVVLG